MVHTYVCGAMAGYSHVHTIMSQTFDVSKSDIINMITIMIIIMILRFLDDLQDKQYACVPFAS